MDIYMKFSRFRKVKKERQVNAFQMSADPPALHLTGFRCAVCSAKLQHFCVLSKTDRKIHHFAIVFARGKSSFSHDGVFSDVLSCAFPNDLKVISDLSDLKGPV